MTRRFLLWLALTSLLASCSTGEIAHDCAGTYYPCEVQRGDPEDDKDGGGAGIGISYMFG